MNPESALRKAVEHWLNFNYPNEKNPWPYSLTVTEVVILPEEQGIDGIVHRFTVDIVIDTAIHVVTAKELRTRLSQLMYEVYLSREIYLDLNVSNKPAA